MNCANCSARNAAYSCSGAVSRVATIARQAGDVALSCCLRRDLKRHPVAAKRRVSDRAAQRAVAALDVQLGVLGEADRHERPAQLIAVAPAQRRERRRRRIGPRAARVGEVGDVDHRAIVARDRARPGPAAPGRLHEIVRLAGLCAGRTSASELPARTAWRTRGMTACRPWPARIGPQSAAPRCDASRVHVAVPAAGERDAGHDKDETDELAQLPPAGGTAGRAAGARAAGRGRRRAATETGRRGAARRRAAARVRHRGRRRLRRCAACRRHAPAARERPRGRRQRRPGDVGPARAHPCPRPPARPGERRPRRARPPARTGCVPRPGEAVAARACRTPHARSRRCPRARAPAR